MASGYNKGNKVIFIGHQILSEECSIQSFVKLMLLVQQLGSTLAECINASDVQPAGNKWCWRLPVIK